MTQEAIAIVGQGCVLPGCFSPDALWKAVIEKQDLLSRPPKGRWGVSDPEEAARPYVGGFVTGFDTMFKPGLYDTASADIAALDTVFQWPLKAASDAWDGVDQTGLAPDKIGVVLANLSYPSRTRADYCADVWFDETTDIDPHNMFHSGGPAHLIAEAIGAGGGAVALDAACASSLYAIDIACRKLRPRRVGCRPCLRGECGGQFDAASRL